MDLIDRIDAILPTIKPGALMHPDFMALSHELCIPDELMWEPITAESAIEFLESKRDELNERN